MWRRRATQSARSSRSGGRTTTPELPPGDAAIARAQAVACPCTAVEVDGRTTATRVMVTCVRCGTRWPSYGAWLRRPAGPGDGSAD